MNAAIDKAFSRIESQNDPLEAGKILRKEVGMSYPGFCGHQVKGPDPSFELQRRQIAQALM